MLKIKFLNIKIIRCLMLKCLKYEIMKKVTHIIHSFVRTKKRLLIFKSLFINVLKSVYSSGL